MFRWHDCSEGHFVLGLLLSLGSFVLLLLTTLSVPVIDSIDFLHLSDGTRYGAFGYCLAAACTPRSVGYDRGPEITEWMTRTQVLFPIAAGLVGLSFVALVLSVLRVGRFVWNPVYFRTCALVGSFVAIAAEVFALVLWVSARHRYNQIDIAAKYGAALWTGLAGTVLSFLSACIGGPAYGGRYGMHWANRGVAYNV